VIFRNIINPASSAIPTPNMYGNISLEKIISIEKYAMPPMTLCKNNIPAISIN